MSRHYELMYNLGVQLLHCGQPQVAFDCLIVAVQHFQVNPYLWLRLAECCIMVQRPVRYSSLVNLCICWFVILERFDVANMTCMLKASAVDSAFAVTAFSYSGAPTNRYFDEFTFL